VPFETVLRHTEAAAAVVDRIVSYVDERIKVETRYWNERKRLKLDLLASGSEDRLDDVMQALMLFQDVQSTQGAVMVEEMEKVGTSGCMRLTPES
jgi:RNA polymerase-interacting CarD/CdnL/TRCF family regulator